MKTKVRIIVSTLSIIFFALTFGIIIENESVELKINIEDYANIHLENCNTDYKDTNYALCDIKNGYNGLCNVEENYIPFSDTAIKLYNASTSNYKTCNSISTSHGMGRENGYQEGFLSSGCGNYSGIHLHMGQQIFHII